MPTLEMEAENNFETTQGQFQKTFCLHLQDGGGSCLKASKVTPKTSMATRQHGVTLQNSYLQLLSSGYTRISWRCKQQFPSTKLRSSTSKIFHFLCAGGGLL